MYVKINPNTLEENAVNSINVKKQKNIWHSIKKSQTIDLYDLENATMLTPLTE